MKNKLTEVVNKTEIVEVSKTNKMCSCETNVVNDLCSSECVDTRRDGSIDVKGRGQIALKIPDFKPFLEFDIQIDN